MGGSINRTVPELAASVFAFLKDLLKLRSRPVGVLGDLARKSGHWVHDLDNTTTASDRVMFWSSDGLVDASRLNASGESRVEGGVTKKQDSSGFLLRVPKILVKLPPGPSPLLGPWISGEIDNPDSEIRLYENSATSEGLSVDRLNADEDDVLPDSTSAEEYENITKEFSQWFSAWSLWATETKRANEVRKLYQSLYDTRLRVRDQDQDWEFVLGIGRLKFYSEGVSLDRHLFTIQCEVQLDEVDGTLSVRIDDTKNFVAEDDWIIGIPKPDLGDLRQALEEINDVDGLESGKFKDVLNRLANRYVAGVATDRDEWSPDEGNSLRLSPSLVLRKKTGQDLIKVLEKLEEITVTTSQVSAPMLSILDPDARDVTLSTEWSANGAAVFLDDELFLPLSLNEKQIKALSMSESRTTTLIQGPPGTGKTRTIAVMVTHFLSRGERVLVTAATSQALKEVSHQIPREMRDLVVSNLGGGKATADDLQKAVNALQSANENRSELYDDFEEYEKSTLKRIDDLHRERAEAFRQIIEIRSMEVGEIEIEGVTGTPAHHASSYIAQVDRLKWLDEVSDPGVRGVSFTPADAEELKSDLRRVWSESSKVQVATNMPTRDQLWTVEKISVALRLQGQDETTDVVSPIPSEIAVAMIGPLESIRDQLRKIDDGSLRWASNATRDLILGKEIQSEINRLRRARDTAGEIIALLEGAGNLSEIACESSNTEWLPILENLRDVVQQRGDLDLTPSGDLKVGLFGGSHIRRAKETLKGVRVLGRFPNTAESLNRVMAVVKADRDFKRLCSSLSLNSREVIKDWDSLYLEASQIKDELDEVFSAHKAMAGTRSQYGTKLSELGYSLDDSEGLAQIIQASHLSSSSSRLKDLNSEWRSHHDQLLFRFKGQLPDYFAKYVSAVENLDLAEFDKAITQVRRHVDAWDRLQEIYRKYQHRFHPDLRLIEVVRSWLEESPSGEREAEIDETINNLVDALRWKRVRDALSSKVSGRYDDLFADLKKLDRRIEEQVRQLSRRRAWKKALDRISSTTLENMSRFAVESKKLGAGTGVTAARRRRSIRSYLDKCTDAIPAWVMPISRIAETFNAELEMFDVVIVDEASQAGIDALFLLALGKRVVVVGDHKQVSPDNMYMKVEELREIVGRHLSGDPREANWCNTDFSLFDECKNVFGAPLTLTEHRRCVPAIIGFSNQIAYEPDGIRLIAVRQTGARSLSPIKTVFVRDGYVRGSEAAITNPPEAEKVVDLIDSMIKDPAYRGKSIGVITLQGTDQQHAIRTQLLDRIDIQEIEEREIRVGNASSFQGSERDVILLSMVMAPNKRMSAQTKENMVQRYNVAMSRAKDQVVLVHSVQISDLKNERDLRWKLLDYCFAIESGKGQKFVPSQTLVPDDVLVEPFDSLFEQRVYNKIVSRGYRVIAQYEPNIDGHSYRIDLVVVGAYGMLAVECDGDHWHGPEEFERDLRRQRILESCNWQFYRIQESEFYNNPKALDELWPLLDDLGLADAASDDQESVKGDSRETLEIVQTTGAVAADDDRPGLTVEVDGAVEELDVEDRGESVQSGVSDGSEGDISGVLLPEEILDGLRIRQFSKQLEPEFRWLRPYLSWDREDTSSFTHISKNVERIRQEIREIVRVEGPILGSYLIRRHYKATGGSSLSANNEKLYVRQLENAVIRNELIAEDRVAGQSLVTATFRLPEQQPVTPRIRGLRDLYDIPPREVAYVIKNTIKTIPSLNLEIQREALYREVLQLLDFTKLTKKSEEFLDRIVAEYRNELT